MTDQELSIVKAVANGMAWPMIVKLLDECVAAETEAALSSTPETALANVMRAQGGRAVRNRFVATATEDNNADSRS